MLKAEILNKSCVGRAVEASARVLLICALIILFFLLEDLVPRGKLVFVLLLTAYGRCCLAKAGMLVVLPPCGYSWSTIVKV